MDWDKVNGEEFYQDIAHMVDHIRSKNQARIANMRMAAASYLNRQVSGFDPNEWKPNYSVMDERLTLNVFRSCVDTITSKITQATPRARVGTFGGSFTDKERARGLEKVIAGVMQDQKGYMLAREAFRQSCIAPFGAIRHYSEGTSLKMRALHPSRLFVDEDVALDKQPTTWIQVESVEKSALKRAFPDMEDGIERSNPKRIILSPDTIADMVEVFEVFKEPCNGQPGWHTISTSEALLSKERWNDPAPYSIIKWSQPPVGWYGIPLWEELSPIQNEIDDWMDIVKRTAKVNSIPRIWVHIASEIQDADLEDNDIGIIGRYAGERPPLTDTPPIAHPQVFDWIQTLRDAAYEITGISQLSASSKKPAGLESGAALREYEDFQTVRFSNKAFDYEELMVDMGEKIIQNAKRLAAKSRVFVNVLEEDMTLKNIDFKEVDMDRDKFKIYIQPASSLPLSPAARLQKVLELARDQLITREQFHSLARVTDLEKFENLESSEHRIFEKVFEKMLREGKYVKPIEYTNLELGLKMCARYYNQGHCDDLDPDKLKLLEDWMDDAKRLLIPDAQPEMMAAPEGPAQGPMQPQQVAPAQMSLQPAGV